MFKLEFTKFLDVKSPVGNGEDESTNIGVDLFMPKFSKELFDAIMESNKKYHGVWEEVGFTIFNNPDIDTEENIVMIMNQHKTSIYSEIQIPTGIAIKLPVGYHADLRGRSSNFKNHLYIIKGLIDNIYTYGMGMQIIPISYENIITLQPEEKLCQIVLAKSYPIVEMIEKSNQEWENDQEIINRREKRTGGFGSTGK